MLLLLVIYVLVLIVAGYAALSAVLGPERMNWAELLGLSFAAGCGIVSLLLFALSLAGRVPSAGAIGAIAGMAVVAKIVLYRRRRLIGILPVSMPRRLEMIHWLGAAALFALIIASANIISALLEPGMSAVDAYAIWMFKAKIVALQSLRPTPPVLLDPMLSYSHQDYPFGFPFVVAGLYGLLGRVDESLGKLLMAAIYFAMVAVVYGSLLRRGVRAAMALAVTAVFAVAPVVVEFAGMPVAELPWVLMHACCLAMLVQWIAQRQRRWLIPTGAFAAFTAFTKNEGLALLPLLALASSGVVAATSRRNRAMWIDWLIASAITVALLSPWLVYRRLLPRTHEDYGSRLTSASLAVHQIDRLPHVLGQLLVLLVQPHSAGAIWLLVVVVAMARWRTMARLPVIVLWGFLLAHFCMYVAVFVVTPWDLNLLLPMVGPKLLMHVSPAAALLIGLHSKPKPAVAT